MTGSQKQLEAHRKNANKGVKSEEGREVANYNALKHGLLAKEIVITVGEGAEDPEEFGQLLDDLQNELGPVGTIEEMLVEKIAAAYWRLRRALRYEVGLIRKKTDTAAEDFFDKTNWAGDKLNKSPEEIDRKIQEQEELVRYWEKDHADLTKMHTKGTDLSEIYDWRDNWDHFQDTAAEVLSDERLKYESFPPEKIRQRMTSEAGWTDDDIWKRLIAICQERAEFHQQKIEELKKEKARNDLKLQVYKKLGNIPV
ncbi:hypothetical protein GWN42_15070 [candidate division KSB1 bacterium]|nr:hypothetical protein [candidate division KSB1 bacterium]